MNLLVLNNGNLGAKTDKGIIDVGAAAVALGVNGVPESAEAFYRAGSSALIAVQSVIEKALESGDISAWAGSESGIGPCVPNPGKIICVGLNYRRHAAEAGMAEPKTPVLFSKFNNTLATDGEDVPLPAGAEQYDYEAELGVVIGKRVRDVSEEEALDYVLGYFTANDVSARDLQTTTSQWLLGKTPDKFFPMGPSVVTTDEIPDPQTLRIRCWINDELRQDSNTGDMIFSVAQVISYISRYFTLEPGDVISTGTPEGVILGMEPKVWMKPGDEVTVEIEKLGRLTNKMVQG